MLLNDKKTINGWAFFDWANSAYYLVISTAVFPIYFSSVAPEKMSLGGLEISNSAVYSFAVSAAYILIAFLSPVLSGIADYSGRRKFFLRLFTLIGAAGCIGLFFFESAENWWLGILAFMIGTIGAAGGLVFYDSYLPLIASEDQYDKVSAKGYAYGYFGSVLLLIVCLIIIKQPNLFFIEDGTLPTRIGFVLVGIWWLGFAQITFRRMPSDNPAKHAVHLLRHGWQELLKVWRDIRQDPQALKFLASYFFYIAGVHTVIYLASIFAVQELAFNEGQLILTILILQLVAILGAIAFAKLSSLRGNKFSLSIQIVIWIVICLGAFLTSEKWQFFILAALVGLVLGGIQSLSRSTYAKLLEGRTEDLTSFFSFYDVLSKLAIVSGTFIFGMVNSITGNMRISVLALMVLFVVGFVFLRNVKRERIDH